MKKVLKIVTSRLFISFLLLFVQVGFLGFLAFRMTSNFNAILTSCLLGLLLGIFICSRDDNPSYKVGWLLLIIPFPIFGIFLYLVFGNKKLGKWGRRKIKSYSEIVKEHEDVDFPQQCSTSELDDPILKRQADYIQTTSSFGLFRDTSTKLFSLGDDSYPVIMDCIRNARKFILLEFFIVDEGMMWTQMLEVLTQKVKEGVEVYFMYDDMGSINTRPAGYSSKLKELGINAATFNPVQPRMNPILNYRDHRKILVIDGNIGFSGGINLADEYINRKIRFGHWKDSVIMLQGSAVLSMTLMFFQLYYFTIKRSMQDSAFDIQKYMPTMKAPSDGFVQVFGDSPLDMHNVSENEYLQIINTATRYVWITTPYLILDNEMITALILAAQSGVDVRIITPHFPDKKTVFIVTQANYRRLVLGGVKIFEYTPGFIHSKAFVSDDRVAVVGTTNMDYRSFYLHFECSVVLYQTSTVVEVRDDIERTLEVCQAITEQDLADTPWIKKKAQQIISLFAPML